MEFHRSFEDGLCEPPASQPCSPGAEMEEMLSLEKLHDVVQRQHRELIKRLDHQQEILKHSAGKTQLTPWSRQSSPWVRQISPPTPTRLRTVPETEGAQRRAKEHAPRGGSKENSLDGRRDSKDLPTRLTKASSHLHKTFRPVFQTFTQADMALRNVAKTVDRERQKRRDDGMSETSRPDGSLAASLRNFVHSTAFDSFFALLVMTNTIFIGAEVQQTLEHGEQPEVFVIIQYIYTGFFVLELLMRMAAGGRQFLCGKDCAWSWLDIFVVASSLTEVAYDILEAHGLANSSGLRALRIVRVTRFLKSLRLIRVFRFVLSLRTLITSIIYTLRSLFWALVLLALIIYLFSVLLAQAVADYRVESALPERAENAAVRYYSSLAKTMLSLFMSITGGVSWEEVLEPLEHISSVWVIVFLIYVQFTYFAVLNVLTGVFCQSAVESAQNDHANVVQSMLANKEAHVEKIRALFSKLGAEEEGIITYDMFEEGLSSPAVMQYFETLGLDVWDAWSFFKLLDMDSGGSVEIEEFFRGCLRFRGQARGVDVGKIIHDQAWLIKNQGDFQTFMEIKMRRLAEMLSAVTGMPVEDTEEFLTSQRLDETDAAPRDI